MILTEPKNQVIHRKNSRKLSNKEQKPVPTSAKAKRKPRQPKESKQPQESKRKSAVITVDVGHTEYFDPKHQLHHRMIYLKLSNHHLWYKGLRQPS